MHQSTTNSANYYGGFQYERSWRASWNLLRPGELNSSRESEEVALIQEMYDIETWYDVFWRLNFTTIQQAVVPQSAQMRWTALLTAHCGNKWQRFPLSLK